MQIRDLVLAKISESLGIPKAEISLEHPELEEHGDFSTNIALKRGGGVKMAKEFLELIKEDDLIKKVEVAGPGFLNIWLQTASLGSEINRVISDDFKYGSSEKMKNKRIIVEYAHPNTHKELHIGHMRTLVTGESLARVLEFNGAEVFRANYQGDIGPQVSKSIWGTKKLLEKRQMTIADASKLDLFERVRLLGEGYVIGSSEYEISKNEIDELNKKLYQKSPDVIDDYQITRGWSLEYYETFYARFGTRFDKLSFESELWEKGLEIVRANIGNIFEISEGATVFPGEKYGLHTRVFITKAETATYEAKEMGLAYEQKLAFPYDKIIHVVANEQSGYFQVVIKALELVDPWFEGRQYHLPMGMINLVGRKISSRKGDVITVDSLLDDVKAEIGKMVNHQERDNAYDEVVAEQVTMAAVKYSILKNEPKSNVEFDLKQSINFEGNSGPYLQYTHARICSVIDKSGFDIDKIKDLELKTTDLNEAELKILKIIYRFSEVVEDSGKRYSSNLICNYLFELAQRFNSFYHQHSILSAASEEEKMSRFAIALASRIVIRNGLELLGIKAPERM